MASPGTPSSGSGSTPTGAAPKLAPALGNAFLSNILSNKPLPQKIQPSSNQKKRDSPEPATLPAPKRPKIESAAPAPQTKAAAPKAPAPKALVKTASQPTKSQPIKSSVSASASKQPPQAVRKLTPEQLEERRRRKAELDAMFGGVNINKNHLKAPERPVDLEKAKKMYEEKLKIQLDLLEKRQSEMKAAERARQAANAAAAAAQNGKGSKQKNGTTTKKDSSSATSPSSKPNLTLLEIERRISALKEKMTPGSISATIAAKAKAAAARPQAASHAATQKREKEDDEMDDDMADFLADEDDDDDGFVVSDDDDWRSALRSVTRYDPRRFKHAADDDDDDGAMEAGWNEIEAEEKRTARIGRMEDEEEERREQMRLQKKKPAPAKR